MINTVAAATHSSAWQGEDGIITEGDRIKFRHRLLQGLNFCLAGNDPTTDSDGVGFKGTLRQSEGYSGCRWFMSLFLKPFISVVYTKLTLATHLIPTCEL